MEKYTQTIKKFRELIMDIYRYAGALDEAITNIETNVNGVDPTIDRFYMAAIQAHHQDKILLFGDLKEKEKDLWQELI